MTGWKKRSEMSVKRGIEEKLSQGRRQKCA
jgi:hypothetical protein